VSPFAGLEENTKENFDILYDAIPFNRPVGIFSVEDLLIPPSWNLLQRLDGFQMVYKCTSLPASQMEDFVTLTEEHIPQMLALTELTNPGPFSSRTIDFGHYEGILDEGSLVAMAGWRLHPCNYVEISAVCTHPDHTGKGYAKQLMQRQIHRIESEGAVPFLHVKRENSRAIAVYKSIGFDIRTAISIFVLDKRK
jgi:predicted GNAT family acetyltransferase